MVSLYPIWKADNQMAWVGWMNNIRSRAMEIINEEQEQIYAIISAYRFHIIHGEIILVINLDNKMITRAF